jgi:predicted outer membrane repeat protein
MKLILTSLLSFALLFSLFLLQPARAADGVVLAPCDEAAFDSVLDTVQASGGGRITFACGGAATITFTIEKNIYSPLTIDGAGLITLSGGGTTSLFTVISGYALTLENLTLTNGAASSDGGVVYNDHGTLTILNSTFTQNEAFNLGGVIASSGVLDITNSQFIDNQAYAGGAIHVAGADSQTTIRDSLFSANAASSNLSGGGAILIDQAANLTLTGSHLSANTAYDGGALLLSAGTTVTVTQTTFAENIAGYGGAIESNGTRLIVHDVIFDGNRTTVGDGGAIWMLSGDLDVVRAAFEHNQTAANGGAISCYGNFFSVIESSFGLNQAEGPGGAIYNNNCDMNLSNLTFSANASTNPGSGGGAIYQEGTKFAMVQYVTITGNTASNGAGIYNDDTLGSMFNISRSIIAGNPGENCRGTGIQSEGYNFSSDSSCSAFTQTGDVLNASLPLGAYTDNGGPTFTHLPLDGNQAIDAIPAELCGFAIDQRGEPRDLGLNCDSGAVELQPGDEISQVYLPFVRR